MFKLDSEKVEEPEIKLPTSVGSLKKQERSRKSIYFCFIDYAEGFDLFNNAEVDVFLELSCFFYDPTDVGNLISGPSAFSKSNLNIGSSRSCTVEAWLGEF